jgi:hypothetical protein
MAFARTCHCTRYVYICTCMYARIIYTSKHSQPVISNSIMESESTQHNTTHYNTLVTTETHQARCSSATEEGAGAKDTPELEGWGAEPTEGSAILDAAMCHELCFMQTHIYHVFRHSTHTRQALSQTQDTDRNRDTDRDTHTDGYKHKQCRVSMMHKYNT